MKRYFKFILIGLLFFGLFTGLAEAQTEPSIENINIQDITIDSATITFDVNQSDANTHVRYGKNGTSLDSKKWNNDSTNSYEITINDLSENTQYDFRVYAENGTNSSKYNLSDLKYFTTKTPTKPSIENINIQDITIDSATITFDVNQSDANTHVRYGKNGTSLDSKEWNNDSTNSYEITINDLSENTQYDFKVYAENGTNSSKYNLSDLKYFTTETPAKPSISGIDSSTGVDNATIIYNVNQSDANTHVKFKENTSINYNTRWNNDSTNSYTVELDGLKANTKYDYKVYAENGTNSSKYNLSDLKYFTTETPTKPSINNSSINVKNINGKSAIITFKIDNQNDANARARVEYGTNESSLNSNTDWYDNSPYEIKISELSGSSKYYFEIYAENKGFSNYNSTSEKNDFTTLSIKGNRIWEEGMSDYYEWTAESYSGFYYDLDSGISSETMSISDINSNIGEGELEYTTSPIETDFEHSGFGSYEVIGFMAERYFAGYLRDNTNFVDEDISMMGDGQLSKVLMDNDERKSVFSGSALTLEEGYRLNIVEVDLQGDSVLVRLTKNGEEIETTVVSADDYYVYEKDLGSTDDVPIIAVNFANVFRGTETNAVFVEGRFQISDEYTEISKGDDYGKMEIETVGESKIQMQNTDSISLDSGDTIDIMGNLNIIVADDNTLRFAPFVDRTEPGTYEVRGTVFEEDGMDVNKWTPLNFEGFYYDIDEGLQTESLKVTEDNGDDIGLDYISDAVNVEFEYENWGKYKVIGFMAEKYFAGYHESNDDNNTEFTDDDISPLSDGQLSKVLIDSEEQKSIYTGSSLILEEGYTLNINEVDVNGDNVFIELRKGGELMEQDIISSGEEYVYEKDLGSTDDVPIIAVRFSEIFRGQETNAVFVDGIFQISDEYTEIESGDSYEKMEIDDIESDRIVMTNDDSIDLGEGDTIDIMGDIKFKVADSDTLRYYPFVEVTTKRGEALNLDIPDTAIRGEPFTISVTSRGAAIEDAEISYNGENVGETSTDGTLEYTPEDTGTYTITAEKQGYVSVSGQVDVEIPEEAKEKMSISVDSEDIFEGDVINITVTRAIGNEPIENADVFFDQSRIGETNENGKLSYTATEIGFHKITVSKQGYKESEENIEILELMADFEFSDLQINPSTVSPGENVKISANATNTGEVSGDYNVELVVNGSVVDSKQINLDVGDNTTVQFNHSEEQAGNYSVEIGGLTGSFKVEESSNIILFSIGIIGAIAAGLGYMFTKGGWTIEMVRGRITELIGRIR